MTAGEIGDDLVLLLDPEPHDEFGSSRSKEPKPFHESIRKLDVDADSHSGLTPARASSLVNGALNELQRVARTAKEGMSGC